VAPKLDKNFKAGRNSFRQETVQISLQLRIALSSMADMPRGTSSGDAKIQNRSPESLDPACYRNDRREQQTRTSVSAPRGHKQRKRSAICIKVNSRPYDESYFVLECEN
jgi:hypothetical protein